MDDPPGLTLAGPASPLAIEPAIEIASVPSALPLERVFCCCTKSS